MKTYPKILHFNNAPFGEDCYAFYKYDGSNVRFEWGKKRGWYKFGSRSTMIDKNTPILGESIDVFLNKYGEDLERIFRNKYKTIESFVVFGEFFGKNSFAGQHINSDKKDVVIFDVNKYKFGFLPPQEFISNFGNLHIPNIIYQGKFNNELIQKVRNDDNLGEGVVCKGYMKTKREGNVVWMSKIKCNLWIEKVRKLYGEKSLIEEFNNDVELINVY